MINQLAGNGKAEDRSAQLLDLIGPGGEWGEVGQCEARIVAEGFGIGGVEFGQGGLRKFVTRYLALCPRRLKLIAQGHQLIDLGNDAVLLGKWGQSDKHRFQLSLCNVLKANTAVRLRDHLV